MSVLTISGVKLKSAIEKEVKNFAWKENPQWVVLRAVTNLVDDEESTVLKESSIRNKYKILSDEPASRGGADKAPAPIEHMIASFGQCLCTIYAYHAALNSISLDEVEVDAQGYVDMRGVYDPTALANRGLAKVLYETRIKSSGNDDKIKWLTEISEKCCPAHATLRKACPLEGKILLNGKELMTVKYSP
jgi:putative redox protein